MLVLHLTELCQKFDFSKTTYFRVSRLPDDFREAQSISRFLYRPLVDKIFRDRLSPSGNVTTFHYYVLNSDLLRDYPIPSTGKQSIHLFASHTLIFQKDWAPKAIPDDAEPHSKEKINELVYNGSLEKSICYLRDMDDEDNQMEHEYIVSQMSLIVLCTSQLIGSQTDNV
ncbi:hypothetical protein F2Q68_00034239 [Brassica cretica]|uniref:Uncharacterized protein n=1 Tax=Brassica cretica TaxID=69181 RepID=A0A8S9HAP3_BRACR|nr:hypothetical protein F2Q68_00034239 [Brassica cretica]